MTSKPQEDAVRRIRFWVEVLFGVVVAVAVAAYSVSSYLGTFAHCDELHSLEQRVTATEARQGAIRDELHWIHEQLIAISRAVDAPVVDRRRDHQ